MMVNQAWQPDGKTKRYETGRVEFQADGAAPRGGTGWHRHQCFRFSNPAIGDLLWGKVHEG